MKRRDFLRSTALVTAVSAAIPGFAKAPRKNYGLQLYTLRDVINTNVKGVMKQVADFGYTELETYGYSDGKLFGLPSKDFAQIARDLGMKITSGHYGSGQGNPTAKGTLVNDWDRAAADAKEAGQEYMVIAHLDENERKTLDDYKKVCDLMNKGGEVCKKHGVRMGYHNHAFEFTPIDGQIPYDLMLKELDPKLVSMEMDLFWVFNAGKDPLAYFAAHPGRFEQWHVKDMDKTDKSKNADVGTGSIDFKPIFAKAKEAGLKHFYVEQETYPVSPIVSTGASIRNMKKSNY